MQIKSNTLVKFVVPVVVGAGYSSGLKAVVIPRRHQTRSTADTGPGDSVSGGTEGAGCEGDTPEDTLRTLIGRLNQVLNVSRRWTNRTANC